MCMRDHLFRNNEGWRRTLIIFEKNSAQDRFIIVSNLLRFFFFSIHPVHKERFSQKNNSKFGGKKRRSQL